jgi:hypothetical protein
MRITAIILVMLLSGCEAINTITKPKMSSDELFSERVEQWSNSKIQEISTYFGGELPLVVNGKEMQIPSNKAQEFSEKSDSMIKKLESDLVEHKNDMAKLNRIRGRARVTSNDFAMTQSALEGVIAKHTGGFYETVVRHRAIDLLNYCKSHDISQRDCRTSSQDGRSSVTPTIILARHLMDVKPEYREYLKGLSSAKESLDKIADKATELGIRYESNMFLKNASSSGCKNMSSYNFVDNLPLAAQIGSPSFRPNKTSVYDLGHFKVLQTQSDGVLLSTTYPDNYNAPLIFAFARKKYTDGYTFQPGEQLACVAGTKEYVSILGIKKRVISFRTINDSTKRFFFLKPRK